MATFLVSEEWLVDGQRFDCIFAYTVTWSRLEEKSASKFVCLKLPPALTGATVADPATWTVGRGAAGAAKTVGRLRTRF